MGKPLTKNPLFLSQSLSLSLSSAPSHSCGSHGRPFSAGVATVFLYYSLNEMNVAVVTVRTGFQISERETHRYSMWKLSCEKY